MLSRVPSAEKSTFMRLNPRSHAAALTGKVSTARHEQSHSAILETGNLNSNAYDEQAYFIMVTERHRQVVERQLQVAERQFQVVERQTQVTERRSGPFRLNLTTALIDCIKQCFAESVVCGDRKTHAGGVHGAMPTNGILTDAIRLPTCPIASVVSEGHFPSPPSTFSPAVKAKI